MMNKSKNIIIGCLVGLAVAGVGATVIGAMSNWFKEPVATSFKFTDIKFKDATYTYDGAVHTCKVENLKDGETAKIYLVNSTTEFVPTKEVGTYDLKAVVTIDDVSRNYFATLTIKAVA